MKKILVIEDEAELRTDLVEGLMLHGYQATGVGDGVDGVNCAFRDQPDLIICDIMMPRLDGYGVARDVRANSLTRLTPFIFVTAKAARDDFRQGMIAGADDYITKPFTYQELFEAIQTRLEKQNVLEEVYRRQVAEWQQALKQAREQELLEAKLLAMLSQGFRNPLICIDKSINLLREVSGHVDEACPLTDLGHTQASVRQLLDIVDDMILLTQFEGGSLCFDPQPLSLDTFVRSTVEEFRKIPELAQQLLYESHFSGTVMDDPRLLRKIMTNLLSNAIKYSPARTPVHVRLDCTGGECLLIVQDQGIGILEAEQIQLFDMFQRGSNVGDIAGAGLGLAIVSQAVAIHHGSIHLTSQVGTGTTVMVAIPIE